MKAFRSDTGNAGCLFAFLLVFSLGLLGIGGLVLLFVVSSGFSPVPLVVSIVILWFGLFLLIVAIKTITGKEREHSEVDGALGAVRFFFGGETRPAISVPFGDIAWWYADHRMVTESSGSGSSRRTRNVHYYELGLLRKDGSRWWLASWRENQAERNKAAAELESLTGIRVYDLATGALPETTGARERLSPPSGALYSPFVIREMVPEGVRFRLKKRKPGFWDILSSVMIAPFFIAVFLLAGVLMMIYGPVPMKVFGSVFFIMGLAIGFIILANSVKQYLLTAGSVGITIKVRFPLLKFLDKEFSLPRDRIDGLRTFRSPDGSFALAVVMKPGPDNNDISLMSSLFLGVGRRKVADTLDSTENSFFLWEIQPAGKTDRGPLPMDLILMEEELERFYL
jgi:hypothetical protein